MRRARVHHPLLSVEASIRSLAPGGDGVAHLDVEGERRAVFVPRSAPGDRAWIAVDASGRPARGRLLELISGGTDRVPVACAWADRCGGCDWMHLSLEAQERFHVEHVRAALPASWRNCVVIQSTPAPGGLGVRSRARIHVRCGRDGRVAAGMHEAGTHSPVEVEECVVLEPPIEAARRALPAWFQGASGRADVAIACGLGGRPVLHARWWGAVPARTFSELEQAVDAGRLAGAQILLDGASRPANVGDPTPWMTGADGLPLRLWPGGFAQANAAVNAELVRHVADLAALRRAGRAVELYAGAGNLGILLAPAVGELVCVESDPGCCVAARANFAMRGIRARVVEADADAYSPRAATDLVILDPPRGGARATVQRLADSRVAHIIYVSCDPPTLGRDLAALESAYAPTSVRTFEMFPQTSHVETVVALDRRRR
ncbi:MAG TPA: methyltransferase [Polyangiaceae bacterium]|nr:methyltransferase [Polyangiaceae bacterium]